MKIVLLSGGSGKRLWPLSNDILSKQFLKLFLNEHGEHESMVQRVMNRLKQTHPDSNVFVSCGIAQKETLQRELGFVETILEPDTRDTFPAVSLAAAYLRYEKHMGQDEVFLVCPIDIFANEKYFELLAEIERLVSSEQYKIGLIGAVPTFPTEKYGYIIQQAGNVTGFVEKPPSDKAQQLIADGALWNTGVFALKIGYALRAAEKYVQYDSFNSLYNQYSKLPQISFDYEVVEKEPSIGVIKYNGMWKDLGTWNTLTEEMADHSIGGNVLISDSCENSHVLNMLDIPVIAQDLQDIVVVASPEGILISSKPGSSHIKPLVEQINRHSHQSDKENL